MEKYSSTGLATDDNTAHEHCMLDTKGYKHTLTIRNTYCFSTTTVVTRTCLNVSLHLHFLSCVYLLLIPLYCYIRLDVTHNVFLITMSYSQTCYINIEEPTRCNSNNLLISKISSTCFGQSFAHLQERKTEILTKPEFSPQI